MKMGVMKVLSAMFHKEIPPIGTFGTIQEGVLSILVCDPYRQLWEKFSEELSSSETQNADYILSPFKDETSIFELESKKHSETIEYYCHYCHTEHYCY